MAKEQSINQIRKDLIAGFDEAETETEKAQIRAELLATMDEKEKAVYLSTPNAIASEIAHLKNTLEALKEKYSQMGDLALIFGYPVSEKIETTSGKFTVQINDTVEVVDTEALKGMVSQNTEIATGVQLAIEKKRAKVTVDTLSATDLKNLIPTIPKKKSRETKVYVR